jgi:hypothetical protein
MGSRAPLLAFVLGVVICYLAVQLRAPDTTEADAHAATADSLRDVAGHWRTIVARDSAARQAERAAYADSLASWDAQRAQLAARAHRASQAASRLATDLRATLDAQQAASLDSLLSEHTAEARAITEERDTWHAEALELRGQVEADSVLIAALWRRVGVSDAGWAAAARETGALRDVIRGQGTQNNVLRAVIGVGLAKAAYDFFSPDKGG